MEDDLDGNRMVTVLISDIQIGLQKKAVKAAFLKNILFHDLYLY